MIPSEPSGAPVRLLEMRGIRKSFDGVEVLHGVDFDLRPGEIHALVGENGAGKSTLIRTLAGLYPDHAGTVHIDGHIVRPRGARQAERLGVAVIHQELALVPDLSVAENVFLGREPRTALGCVDRRAMRRAARTLFREQLAADLDVDATPRELPLAAQQLCEIARALGRRARIVVMDEPTSALSQVESQRLFDAVRRLRARGAGVIYVSHRLEEIYALADRISVLRDGRLVGCAAACELDRDALMRLMIGRPVEQLFPRHAARPGPEALRVDALTVDAAGRGRPALHDATLCCRRGEIVGLWGLLGCGASELLGALFGRFGRRTRGQVRVDGLPVAIRSPREAMAHGVALCTSDRKADGLVMPMSVLANLTLPALERCRRAGLLSSARERALAAPLAASLDLRAARLTAPVASLSGGNQQKVALGKWLLRGPRILLLDDPTRGVDVGAKGEIYGIINRLAESGAAVLLTSGQLEEVLGLCDRIYVMHRGRIVGRFERGAADREALLRAAMGG